ncbi:MAG: hypothetical protein AAF492_01425 [Verrucomicrobiota bacterium]
MKKSLLLCILLAIWAGGLHSARADEPKSHIAIIVNKNNEIKNLSLKDLTRYLKLDKQHWKNGKKIYLVMQQSGSMEKKALLNMIYHTDDAGLKRYWLGKMFRGEIVSIPKTFNSNDAIKKFVSQVPSAIGFINASDQDDSVKAIQIDGYSPGDQNYPLIARAGAE